MYIFFPHFTFLITFPRCKTQAYIFNNFIISFHYSILQHTFYVFYSFRYSILQHTNSLFLSSFSCRYRHYLLQNPKWKLNSSSSKNRFLIESFCTTKDQQFVEFFLPLEFGYLYWMFIRLLECFLLGLFSMVRWILKAVISSIFWVEISNVTISIQMMAMITNIERMTWPINR